jgi:antitoxin ParD1/3/4
MERIFRGQPQSLPAATLAAYREDLSRPMMSLGVPLGAKRPSHGDQISAVEAGDYASTSEVVRAALRDWKMKRALQVEELAALKADIDAGLADVAAGRVKDFDATRIVERGRKLLAARSLRHLFDWRVTGQVVPANPAASVRGPQHIVKGGKTPVLDPAEARAVLDSIDTATPAGLRNRTQSRRFCVNTSSTFMRRQPHLGKGQLDARVACHRIGFDAPGPHQRQLFRRAD